MPPSHNKSPSFPTLVVAGIVVVFLSYAAVLWTSGMFRFDGTESSAKVVAATLALVAGLCSALLSLVGVWLRHSIDERAETRLQIESDRNDALRSDAEARLKLEASVRAIELIKSSDQNHDLAAQRTAVLFTLASLKLYALAATLVDSWIKSQQIDRTVASNVLNEILQKGDLLSQQWAIALMVEFPDRVEMPNCLLGSWASLPEYTRDWAAVIIAGIFMSESIAVRRRQDEMAVGMIAALGFGWQTETNARIKQDTGAVLAAFLRLFPEFHYPISTPAGGLDLRRLVAETRDSIPSTRAATNVLAKVETWAAA